MTRNKMQLLYKQLPWNQVIEFLNKYSFSKKAFGIKTCNVSLQ